MTREFLTRIQNKRDTSANWTENNPVILNGEIILVDTAEGELRAKIGDGAKTYTQLPFSDEVLKSLINTVANTKVDRETGKGLSTNDYTAAEKQNVADNTAMRHSHSNKDVLDKITGIVTEDNVNSPVHTSDLVDYSGFQAGSQQIIDQIPKKTSQLANDSDYVTATDLESKVDKVTGKGLSSNDYTNEDKEKLDGITGLTNAQIATICETGSTGEELEKIIAITNAQIDEICGSSVVEANGVSF